MLLQKLRLPRRKIWLAALLCLLSAWLMGAWRHFIKHLCLSCICRQCLFIGSCSGICLFGSLCPGIWWNCVYCIEWNHKILCDYDSSALGSIRCYNGDKYCPGAKGDGSVVGRCYPHDTWSGTVSGSTYYFFIMGIGKLAQNPHCTPGYAFSGRCVLVFNEIVFIV